MKKIFITIAPLIYWLIFVNLIDLTTGITYFWVNIFQFYIPGIILSIILRNYVKWKAFLLTFGIFFILTGIYQFVGYQTSDIWKVDSMIGVYLFKIPIEEFMFWWGATYTLLLLYVSH